MPLNSVTQRQAGQDAAWSRRALQLTWYIDVNVPAFDLTLIRLSVVVVASVPSGVGCGGVNHFQHCDKEATVVLLTSDFHVGVVFFRHGVLPAHFTLPNASQRKGRIQLHNLLILVWEDRG
jgi:hypothetical protein